MMDILLQVEDLVVNYGGIKALQGISIKVHPGEIVTIIGANGAGKSSLLRAISGMVTPHQGKITFKNQDISRMKSHEIARLGISHVPEGRGVFAKMTVEENLMVATYARKDSAVIDDLRHVYQLFPRLEERKKQAAGTLSGGEQQMLAIGRALMSGADTLLLDEPSMGLAPLIVQEIFSIIRTINQEGKTIILVEQNATQALKLANRAYILETGKITLEGPAQELLNNADVKKAYLGG
ncbi:MAG: ABC transporter ATP-binding protein [Bacillaceae bacterium G1]|nr:ABC transporter ATP-binding protein [Bacillota bacterium]OJF16643.1 MAG: ABC transporter ATP-binding protein [Bacillaceae bacterium G1]